MNINLIEKNDKIIIAFSCGPDSVYLFTKLNEIKEEYNLKLKLVYINHKIRKDVENDIIFLKNFSKKYNVEYEIYDIDKENPSENYSREFRYKVLNFELGKMSFNKIATGHNLNDNVETFLFRLIRGTSLDGLKSIQEKKGNVIRPILNIEKKDILKFLDENNLEYIVDYTNLENNYSRNKIRNLILPIMREINPKVDEKIIQIIEEIKNKNTDDKVEKIKEILNKNNIQYTKKIINSIKELKDEGTTRVSLPNDLYFVNSYGNYSIEKKENIEKKEEILEINNNIDFFEYNIGIYDENQKNIVKKHNLKYNKDMSIFLIDKNISKLSVRTRNNGDRIYLEKIGNKLVKKILIDNKIPILMRDKLPIVTNDSEILLVSNLRYSKLVKKIQNLDDEIDGNILYIIKKEK